MKKNCASRPGLRLPAGSREGELLFAAPSRPKPTGRPPCRASRRMPKPISPPKVSKEHRGWALAVIDDFVDAEVTRRILDEGKRADGRRLNEIGPSAPTSPSCRAPRFRPLRPRVDPGPHLGDARRARHAADLGHHGVPGQEAVFPPLQLPEL